MLFTSYRWQLFILYDVIVFFVFYYFIFNIILSYSYFVLL